MFALVSTEKIQLPAGAFVRLPATWKDYQKLCQRRYLMARFLASSIALFEVILMSPLPKHGRDAHLIANVITTKAGSCGT